MFRFTIRDVLWLMVLVGLGVAWWVDHSRLDSRAAKAEAIHGDYVKMLNMLNPNRRTISQQTPDGFRPIAPESILKK